MSKIVIDVDRAFHDLIKIEAIKHGQSMKDFIVSSMQKIIDKQPIEKDFKTELKSFMSENQSILKELADK